MSLKTKKVLWVLKRLITYPFCIGLIVMGIYMLADSSKEDSHAAGLGAVVISAAYLTMDIIIIVKRYKDGKKNDVPD